ncbi:cell division protein FtsQ/DivIB [Actinacidiphila yeochonensis]|uniref:cell division protein FtsQ/DivIB n=1 Tax=Actinacidiphila yeochonensis TaxID=89050 RepID=UPI000AB10807|nr:FtsQ-type POTRA domain-containing protein [Actinacidiphila yeochonensis]
MTASDGTPVRRRGLRRPAAEPAPSARGFTPAGRNSTAPARDAVPRPAGAPQGDGPPGTAEGGEPRTLAHRRRVLLVLLLAAAVLVGGGSWLVWGSPLLRADRVTVHGNQVVSDDQIIRAAHVPLGGALVSVDTGAVRRRLLAALPRLRAVRVDRSWPHTVRLDVTERTPSAVLPDGRRWTEVDSGGVRFATVDQTPKGVPVIRLDHPLDASVRQFGTKRLLQAAIEVSAALPAGVRGHATAILVRSYDGITVELTGGRTVVWGSRDGSTRKAVVLTALMRAQPDADHYDVSAPDAPAASAS